MAALLADAGLAVWAGCAACCARRPGTKAITSAIQVAFHVNIFGLMIRAIGSPNTTPQS